MVSGSQSPSEPPRPASSTRPHKRKREKGAAIERRVARKLQECADITETFSTNQRSLNLQFQRYKAHKSRADELSRLHLAAELTSQFQTLFGAEMVGHEEDLTSHLMSLHKRLDKMLKKMASKTRTTTQKTQKVVTRLPRLMDRATSVVSERRRLVQEQNELPAKHQWVPMVLWKLYEDVVEVSRREENLKPMKSAMHEVMKTLKETNPFFYLQVLYQPPPEYLDGRWEIEASEKLTAITASMTPFFRNLKRRSAALRNKRDSYMRIHNGWNQLRVTMTYARRAARHFHFLILHLYAVAMGCEAPNVHAGIISEKAARGIFHDGADLRARLGLCRESASSEDHLVKETYEWTPELLVYIDEWRQQQGLGKTAFGFDRREREQDFLPQFSAEEQPRQDRRRIPRCDVLAEVGLHLRHADRAWRMSRLGTSRFESMQIVDIGVLEMKIKRSLAAVVDLVYKMMLARWMDRRGRSAAWWTSLKLRESICREDTEKFEREPMLPPELLEISTVDPPAAETVEHSDDLRDVTDAESVEQKDFEMKTFEVHAKRGFRHPTTVTLLKDLGNGSAARGAGKNDHSQPDSVVPRPLTLDHTIRLQDIYAWSDGEIKYFQSDRVPEVRTAMLDLHDRLKWSIKTATEITCMLPADGYIRNDWCVACLASHLCSLTNRAVAFGEEIALNDASVALTRRPSLRGTVVKSATGDNVHAGPVSASEETSVDLLQASVHIAHQRVIELLALYEGQRSTEWRDYIEFAGRAAAQLLRLVSQDGGVSEL